jgi:hypothetical protein
LDLRAIAAPLMFTYATLEERAAWETAGRPPLDAVAWTQALDEVYAVE